MNMNVGVSSGRVVFSHHFAFCAGEYCNSKFLTERDSDWCDLSQVALLCPERCVQESRHMAGCSLNRDFKPILWEGYHECDLPHL